MEVQALRELWYRCLDESQEDWNGWKVETRPVNQDDWHLLFGMYTETRQDILALTVNQFQKNYLIEQQFELQQQHYRKHFSDALFEVVEVNQQPIGRWYYHATENEHRVVDVIVSSQYRRQGIGSILMRAAMLCVTKCGVPLRLRAGVENPARHWYLSMGFSILEYEPAHWHLQFTPVVQEALLASQETGEGKYP